MRTPVNDTKKDAFRQRIVSKVKGRTNGKTFHGAPTDE